MTLAADLADHLDLAVSDASMLAANLAQARSEARVLKAASRTLLVRRARRLLARVEAIAHAHGRAVQRERGIQNSRKAMARAKLRRIGVHGGAQ